MLVPHGVVCGTGTGTMLGWGRGSAAGRRRVVARLWLGLQARFLGQAEESGAMRPDGGTGGNGAIGAYFPVLESPNIRHLYKPGVEHHRPITTFPLLGSSTIVSSYLVYTLYCSFY